LVKIQVSFGGFCGGVVDVVLGVAFANDLVNSVPLFVPLLSARTCDLWVSEYNNGILDLQDFSQTYDCAGKSSQMVEAITSIVGAGCCGGNSGLARSACFKDRSHICKTAANYLPSAQVTVGDGGNTMTCDALVENTPNGALTGQDFSSTYDCAGKSEEVLQGIGLVVGAGCCGGIVVWQNPRVGKTEVTSAKRQATMNLLNKLLSVATQ
jgi:hypothetical protein